MLGDTTRLLDDLHIDETIDPRLTERSSERIAEYAGNMDNLPPILIDEKNRVLDGVHRFHAHKLAGKTEIRVNVVKADSRREALAYAIKDNARHGQRLTTDELKHSAINLFHAGATDAFIAKTISRSQKTVSNYLREAKAHLKDEAKTLAVKLREEGCTQHQIANSIEDRLNHKVDQTTVSAWLRENTLAQVVAETQPEIVEQIPQKRPESEADVGEIHEERDEETERIHSEMQWMLLWLGNKLNLDLWLPKTDLTQSHKRNEIANLSGMLEDLPFDILKVGRSVQRIDVLWLKDNKIIATFEIENSTGIESGLFRMSHMWVSMQDQAIRTFIVAPDTDVNRAGDKINEPTFKHIGLAESCWFLPYSALTNKYNEVKNNGSIPYNWQELLEEIGHKL